MRVLILGGGGFIGSALVQWLARKFTCVCFGHDSNFNRLQQRVPATVEFVAGDVGDRDLVAKVMRNVESVIFVAGTGGEDACLANPVQAVATQVGATHIVLQQALRQDLKRFIFTSTIAAYGTYLSRPMPLTEDAELRPDDLYGVLKATAEREIIDSGQFQIFRLANVYGPTHSDSLSSCGVIGRFVAAATTNQDLRVFGDGTQEIDYVHINDVCRAFEMALDRPPQNFIYNVGGGQPVSILKIANLVKEIARERLGRNPRLELLEAERQKVWPNRWLSISKIEDEMQWRPTVSLRDGVHSMLLR